MARRPKSKSLSATQRSKIFELASQGYESSIIAEQLDIKPVQQVSGYINTCRNMGRLPKLDGSVPYVPPPSPAPLPQQTAAPAPAYAEAPHPIYQQQPAPGAPASADDFSGGRPVLGGSDGWAHASQDVRYIVERVVPPDGLLGTHYGSFTRQQLGETYGEGQYKIQKFELGKPIPFEHIVKVSSAFGQARFPATTPAPQQGAPGSRPGYRPTRPWQQGGAEADPAAGAAPAPGNDPRNYLRAADYYRDLYRNRFSEPARQAPTSDATMTELVRQMGTMHEKSLDKIDKVRESGPESAVTRFFQEQQDLLNLRFGEERKRDEERRREEELKAENRRKEEQETWRRRQDEEGAHHQRELERIKAEAEARGRERAASEETRAKREAEERRFLLDLEERKLALIQKESELQQKRLETEIARARDDMKTLQDRTSKELAENRESIDTELGREREGLDREHRLREKSLDKEHELNHKMLEIEKQLAEAQQSGGGGDAFFSTLNNIVKELSKGVERILEIKKLQAMSPEAQAAATAKGTIDGNVLPEPERATKPEAPAAKIDGAGVSASRAAATEPPGNGHGKAGDRMDELIHELLGEKMFRQILKEWAIHVDSGCDATAFANLFLEMLRDEHNGEKRQACNLFLTYMKPRKWARMYPALEPHLDEESKAIFRTSDAEPFYESFRGMVVAQVQDYWEQFSASRVALQERAAGQSPAAPEEKVESPASAGVPSRGGLAE
jgi:hypothetical protein